MTKYKKIILAIDILLLGLLIFFDQLTKNLAVGHLKNKPAYNILDGILELNYLENKGAAFGMLQNQKLFFIFVAVIILGVIAYILYKTPDHKKYNMIHLLLIMIASGAIGNMIDRLKTDYVVDFIYFVCINFPVFNVADIYVTVGTCILAIFILFVYKEEDLKFISFKQQKFREIK